MGGSPGQAASADIAAQNADNQKNLLNISLPAIDQVLAAFNSDLSGPGGEPASVAKFFSNTRNAVGANFNQAEMSSSEAIATRAKSMGLDYRPDAVASTQATAHQQLEQQRGQSLQQLGMEEANFGLNSTEMLLGKMGKIESMLAAGATGFGGAALGAAGMMGASPWQSALGGAASGAAIGSEVYPGWGTAIGAVVGGAGGYFGGG